MRRSLTIVLAFACLIGPTRAEEPARSGVLKLSQRSRVARDKDQFEIVHRPVTWDAKQTAVIVCDMWDQHHCLNAVRRVVELAPRMNQVLDKARGLGVLIIHAPSSCMGQYKDHPARERAQEAPQAANLPKDIGEWCRKVPAEEQGVYPLDQSDGGCDSDPVEQREFSAKLKAMGRNPATPWLAQTDLLKIHDEDAISDSGVEIWDLLEQRGIKNVILVGVHTNMCVLGRPFGLRQLAKNGKYAVLMRDMTDTMYNPARWPYVSHFRGTDRIVEHIEKFVCPTVTSDQLLGGRPFRFQGDVHPKVVVLIAETEYNTKTTLPPLLRHLEDQLGVDATILDGSDRQDIPGMAQALAGADLVMLSARRRALPRADLEALKQYLDAGKPLIALRTSSHAFDAKGKHAEGQVEWPAFDAEVLGGNYHNHHGTGSVTTVQVAAGAEKRAILAGIRTPFESKGTLYKTSPLASSTTALLVGSVPGQDAEPVAWTNTYKKGRIFYTSLGHPEDFRNPQFVRLMHNAVCWAMQLPDPQAAGPRPDVKP